MKDFEFKEYKNILTIPELKLKEINDREDKMLIE